MGLVMNLYVVMSCFFHRITEINPITGEVIPSTSKGYGLIARETAFDLGETPSYQKCTIYPPDEQEYLFDWWMSTARNMAFLAGFLALCCFIVLIFSYCFRFTQWTMERWLLWAYLYAAMAMALVMLMWGGAFCKENKCQVAQGTGYVISCFFTHLMMANTVKSMGQPPPKNEMPEPGGREDDYWYEEGDPRFPDYDSDNDQRSVVSADSAEFEQFEDELENERKKRNAHQGRFANVQDYENDGINEHHEDYDEMTQYMSETAEQKPDDYQDFLDKDEQSYRRSTRDYDDQYDDRYDDRRAGGDNDTYYEDEDDQSRFTAASSHRHHHEDTDSLRPPEGNMGVGYERAEEEDRQTNKMGDHTLI